jgi:STE24 endopeptidase
VTRVLLALAALVVAAGAILGAAALWGTIVPQDLALPSVPDSAFDAEVVGEARDFEGLMRVSAVASLVVLVVVLALYARHGAKLMSESAAGPIGTGFLLGIVGIGLVWLAQAPFGLFEVWWARRHDALETNYADWFFGEWGALFGDALFLSATLLLVMALARLVRSAWWAPASVAVLGLALGIAFAAPYLYPGLEEPPATIRADAAKLADKGLPRVPVKVEEVTEWTSDPNAFAFGLGDTRRVVLWDTLTSYERDEVRVVLAHELAHHDHDHIAKQIGWLAIFIVPAALIVALVTRRRGGLARPEAVPLALLVIVVLNVLAMPLQNSGSRRYEAEADWAALRATDDPRAMESLFRRFTEEGLSDPSPPGWFHTIFDTHPSGAERVAMARAYAAQREGR